MVIIGTFSFYKGKKNETLLKLNHEFTFAKVKSVSRAVRPSGHIIGFKFRLNNQIYTGSKACSYWHNFDGLVDKYLPLAYYPADPTINELLVLPEDYEKYNVAIPDSLNWIKQL